MYNKEQALHKMQQYVSFLNELYQENSPGDYKIVIKEVSGPFNFGWIFGYMSRDNDFLLAGNAPVIIEKNSLDMYHMISAYRVEENVALYKCDKTKLGRIVEKNGIWDITD